MKKSEWRTEAQYWHEQFDEREREGFYLRHQINQAIQTIDIGNVVPPGTFGTTGDRLLDLSGQRKAYLMVLSMLQAPVPPHFNPEVRNTYAEPKPLESDYDYDDDED
jgi:hypothetical protein